MSAPSTAAVLLIAVALSPLAAAHHDHEPCPVSSATVVSSIVHVDRWRAGCIGLAVSSDLADCSEFLHVHSGGFHVFVLSGTGCQSGIILENLETGALP